jgi:uncharacterized protein CbrC (UPF0167 family)
VTGSLPHFRYHPDPLKTGSVRESPKECRCCRRRTGYIYLGPVYSRMPLRESLCPWCVASGAAAREFGAAFSDAVPLAEAGLEERVIEEVTNRTPGFNSWRQEAWLVHCGDACAFNGDALREALRTEDAQRQLAGPERVPQEQWSGFIQAYRPGGNPAVYEFRCLSCGAPRFQVDFT